MGFLRLAELQLAKKDQTKAEKSLEEALRLAKENELFGLRCEALLLQGQTLLEKGEINAALNCSSEACTESLQSGWVVHNVVVNGVVGVLNRLRREGRKKVADQIGKHLIEIWKKQRLDEKIPQFIEHIERNMSNSQS